MNIRNFTIIGVALLMRLLVLSHYGPVAVNDTPGYERMAAMMRTGDYSEYDGWRTPGYPLFMNIMGNSAHNIVLAQSVLGIATVFIIYLIVYKTTGIFLLAACFGIFVGTAFNIVFIDSYLLTESIATFLFTAIAAIIIVDACKQWRFAWGCPLCVGLITAYLTITRPQYIALIPVIALWLIFCTYGLTRPKRASRFVAYTIAASMPVLLLVMFNYSLLGKPLLSTTVGHNITQHTLPFIESASKVDRLGVIPEMIELRDAYWQYAQDLGDNRAFIPRPHIDGTGKDSSDYYLQLSIEAIKHNPDKYLLSAANAWLRFWRVSLLYDATYVHSHALDTVVSRIWVLQKLVWLALNVLFIISAVLMAHSIVRYRTIGWYECITVMILAVSVLQALVEYGDNSRYAIPVQPVIGVIAVYSIFVADRSRTTIASTLRWFRWRFTTASEA